jgi:hypothetical protein
MVSHIPLNNTLPLHDGHEHDDGMSWYDESVAANEVDIVTSSQYEKDFSEVSYSPFEKDVAATVSTASTTNQTRSTADLLLGTLPPAPPLADDGDIPEDHVRQARLRNALSIKVREAHKLSKSLIDGGSGHRTRPRRRSSIVRKHPEETKEDVQKVSLQHHSPIGVWEMFDTSQNFNTNEPYPMTPVSRFSVIDAIFTRQEERRAGCDYSPNGTSYLPSSQPRQQKASLHKEWKNQISGNLNELVAQSDELMHDIMSAEERLYKKLHG